jgi:hypothetical protein
MGIRKYGNVFQKIRNSHFLSKLRAHFTNPGVLAFYTLCVLVIQGAFLYFQIANESKRFEVMERPWLNVEDAVSEPLNDSMTLTTVNIINSGNSAARNFWIRTCQYNSLSRFYRNDTCLKKGWEDKGPFVVLPHGKVSLTFIQSWRRDWMNETNQSLAIYGSGTYQKPTDNKNGGLDFCLYYYPLLKKWIGCKSGSLY